MHLLILIFYWSIPLLISLSLGSAERLYIVQFAIFLFSEEGMLNATETAVCNLSEFYWCSKRCLFFWYQSSFVWPYRQAVDDIRTIFYWLHFLACQKYVLISSYSVDSKCIKIHQQEIPSTNCNVFEFFCVPCRQVMNDNHIDHHHQLITFFSLA